MKTELSKISKDLEQGRIDETEARILLLGLLGVEFVSGLDVVITAVIHGHEFEIGETVTLIEEDGEQWLAENERGERWFIVPEETNVSNIK